jgi:hypothetical protein
MNFRLIARTLIFILFFGCISGVTIQASFAAECIKSSTFQNGYMYLAFKDTSATCTWTVPSDASIIDYLLIGGGGSGGTRHGGGGGAGGLLKGTNISLTGITALDIKVAPGAQSVSRSSFNYATGLRGETSTIVKSAGSGTFTSLAAVGGGGGEAGGQGAQSGGSGGGSQYGTPSTPVAGQGNSGGTGSSGNSEWWSGGGGGAGTAGANGTSTAGGAGGTGAIWILDFTTTIATALGLAQTNQTSGNQVYFAGGGGGSITTNNAGNSNTAGGGGLGGGGAAALGNNTGTSGTANSGGGGGGSGCCDGGTTGAGGSGLALIRYQANAGLSLSIANNPIYRANTNIVATANIDGKVTFYANKKVIPNCKNKSTSAKTVTCVWRPSVHGRNSITATIVSSSFSSYTGSFASTTQISKRSGNR